MSLDDSGLLIRGSLSLSLAELLDETHRLALETALEAPAGTSMDDLYRSWCEDSGHAQVESRGCNYLDELAAQKCKKNIDI